MNSSPPKVFISYCWESEEHVKWTLDLADQLREDGISSELDQYHLQVGFDEHEFEEKIVSSDKVITILTPTYKKKADERIGGVGKEFRIIVSEFIRTKKLNINKIIPVIRKGDKDLSIPNFFGSGIIYIDFTDNNRYENSYNKLIRSLHNEPYIQAPMIKSKPNFAIREINVKKIDLDNIYAREGNKDEGNSININVNLYKPFLDIIKEFLAKKSFYEADLATIKLFLNSNYATSKIITHTLIENVPCSVFSEIDELWRNFSDNKFGFKAQIAIWNAIPQQPISPYSQLTKFADALGWRKDNNWIKEFPEMMQYDDLPYGHFPRLRQLDYNKYDWLNIWQDNILNFVTKSVRCLI